MDMPTGVMESMLGSVLGSDCSSWVAQRYKLVRETNVKRIS